jgi:signal transduction histidine kinase
MLGLISVAEMESNSKELPYLGLIRDRVKHLDNFIKSILDYSRNARTEIKPALISIERIIEEAKDSVRAMNGFNSLAVRVTLNQTAQFYSDPVRLSIIVNNLVTNAIKFQDYTKEQSYFEFDIDINHERLVLKTSDNGIGIATEHQQKVFDMFYRGTDRTSGSGIGLYLVKQTVEKMKGTIGLTSELGKYTHFEVTLPNSKG